MRLAPDEAARLQEALIPDAVEKARTVAPVTVAVSPAEGMGSVRRLVGPSTPLIAQPGGDLGGRMLDGARRLFAEGPGPVVILGTDAPALPPGYISEAVRYLLGKEGYDAALTPSRDGGYVLIGLRAPHDALFEGISWSTPEVYSQTLAGASRAGLSVYETPPCHDVDEPEDLERLRPELAREPRLAPRTARVLAARGI